MSGLLCRIAAYDFSDDEKSNSDDDQLGPTLAPLTESNGRLASFSGLHLGVASDTSDSELDGDIHNPLYADGSATWVMLTNLVQRCCSSLKTNERVVDYVVESERWVPVPAKDEDHWSRKHLWAVDWKPFEGASSAQSPELAQHLASRGAVWASESPLPDPLLWDWADPTWMPSADDPDHLAANAGWWYGTHFPGTDDRVARVRSMSPVDLGRSRHFVRCRLWSRARVRVSLAETFARLKRQASTEASTLAANTATDAATTNGSERAGLGSGVEKLNERSKYPYGGASLAEALLMLRHKVDNGNESSDNKKSSSDQGAATLVVVDCNSSGDDRSTDAEARMEGANHCEFEVDVEEWLKAAAALEKTRRDKVVAKAKAKQNILSPKWFQPSVWFSMERELVRAAAVVRAMTTRNGASNRERVPVELLRRCKGVAVLQFAKVGMGFGGRVGTGVVVAKRKPRQRRRNSQGLEYSSSVGHRASRSSTCDIKNDKTGNENDDNDDDDDENGCDWSAPSAILLMGLGGGLQIGAEVGALLLVLWTDAAVAAFSGSQVTLGADIGVALGPVGRAASVSLSSGRLDKPSSSLSSSPQAPSIKARLAAPTITKAVESKLIEAQDSKSSSNMTGGSGSEDESGHGSEEVTSIDCGPSSSVIMGHSNHGGRAVGHENDTSIGRSSSSNDHGKRGDLRRASSEQDGKESESEQQAPTAARMDTVEAVQTARAEPKETVQGGGTKEQEVAHNAAGSGAAIFAYAHQQGLFLGLLTLEGAVIVPRQDTNQSFYGSPARTRTASVGATTNTSISFNAATTLNSSNSASANAFASTARESGSSSARRQRRSSGRAPPPGGWATAALSGTEPQPEEAQPLYDALLDAFGGADTDALADAFTEADVVQ